MFPIDEAPDYSENPCMNDLVYRRGNDLDLDQVIALYVNSTLGQRRPVGHRRIMEAMLREANLVITAWRGGELVGIARTLTDFSYVAYLADLAVDRRFQKRGIGRALIDQTRAALEPTCFITLLAAPAAQEYYPKVGFIPHHGAWVLPAATSPLTSPPAPPPAS